MKIFELNQLCKDHVNNRAYVPVKATILRHFAMPPADIYTPSHSNLFRVSFSNGNFSSKLLAMRAFSRGETIAHLEDLTPGPKLYSTIQVSRNSHVELNSDLMYMNHACRPSATLDVEKMAVIAAIDLAEGNEITIFYPATEWDMGKFEYLDVCVNYLI